MVVAVGNTPVVQAVVVHSLVVVVHKELELELVVHIEQELADHIEQELVDHIEPGVVDRTEQEQVVHILVVEQEPRWNPRNSYCTQIGHRQLEQFAVVVHCQTSSCWPPSTVEWQPMEQERGRP